MAHLNSYTSWTSDFYLTKWGKCHEDKNTTSAASTSGQLNCATRAGRHRRIKIVIAAY